jgi:O-antigen/teichoic acid export membrane protein
MLWSDPSASGGISAIWAWTVNKDSSLSRKVPAGLVDAGASSLATFVVGISAAQLFDAAMLGIYAVFFTSYQLGLVLPMFLIYLPAEVSAVERPILSRLTVLRSSLPLGLATSAISLLAIGLAVIVVRGRTDPVTVAQLALTAMVPLVLMSAQAHIRRTLHIAHHSWRAATISIVQLVVTGTAVATLVLLGVSDALIPFGALGTAAVVSFVTGYALAASLRQTGGESLHWTELTKSGRWLLVTGIAPNVANFAIAAIVGSLAGLEALGYAEAARLVAQPLIVLAVGLNASLGPRSMEAASQRDRPKARRVSRLFVGVIAAAALGYLVIAGGPWPWNPLMVLIPQAYVIPGLVAVTVIASTMAGAVMPNQRELYGGRYEKRLALVDVVAASAGVLTSITASVTGAFARPISVGTTSGVRGVLYQWPLRRMYGERDVPDEGSRRSDEGGIPSQENSLS